MNDAIDRLRVNNFKIPKRDNSDRWIVSARECVWPECYGKKAMWGVPLCEDHAMDVFDQVILNNPMGYLEARQNGAKEAENLQETLRKEDQERQAQKLRASRTHPGWVYYIRIDGQIKIGWTRNVENRTRAYPPSSVLLATHPGTTYLERQMHKKFAHLKAKGREWFLDDPSLEDHIAKVRADFPDQQQKAYQFRDARGTSKAQPVRPRSYRG